MEIYLGVKSVREESKQKNFHAEWGEGTPGLRFEG